MRPLDTNGYLLYRRETDVRNIVSSHLNRGFDRLSIANAFLWAGLILALAFILRGSPYAEEVVLITVLAAGTSLTLNQARSGGDSPD